jgi:hypothetical protein
MSEQQSQTPTTATSARPAPEGYQSWNDFWKAQGMPWRTEPLIDEERQRYLAERRSVRPDDEQGIYPFRDENGGIRLCRADVEWLLATHESGGATGPVIWEDEQGKPMSERREGLDLRGADLRAADLRGLPLASALGGRTHEEWPKEVTDIVKEVTAVVRRRRAVHLEGADLRSADLRNAALGGAFLERADFSGARLDGANLSAAFMSGTDLFRARLERADLREVNWDATTSVREAVLATNGGDSALLADLRWDGVNLSVMKWGDVATLGDERIAKAMARKRSRRDREERLAAFQAAVRANRQLAVTLRSQGVNEHADRFAYRAQVLQRQVLRRQRRYLSVLGSWFLDLISGYGYRPLRSFIT